MAIKLYRRTSDNVIEAEMWYEGVWSTPADWTGVGTTHDEIDSPDGIYKGSDLFYVHADGYVSPRWKVPASSWVERPQGELDARYLVESKKARRVAATKLRAERDAIQALIDDPSTPAEMVTDLTADRDALDAEISSHQTNWGSIWSRGSNP